MTMNNRKIVLYAKTETTYGVDPTPSAVDAMLVDMPTIDLIGKKLDRKVVLPTYGTLAGTNVGEGMKISFNSDLLCSGTAGTAPKLGRLLRACNMTETVTAATKVDYDLNSSQEGESVTFWFFKDGQKYVINGCVGTVKGNFKANELPTLSFEFTGIYNASFASTVALPTPTFGTDTGPFIFRGAAFTFMDLTAPIFESFDFDLGNEIGKRPNANAASGVERYFIKARAVKGSIDPEVVALSTFDAWTKWDQSTPGAISCQVGSVTGSKCLITAPNIVLTDAPKQADRENITTYALAWNSYPTMTAGNNELKLSFQ